MQNLFEKLCEEGGSLKLLKSWSRNLMFCNNQKGITFVKLVGRKGHNDKIKAVYLKETTIDENMTFIIKNMW